MATLHVNEMRRYCPMAGVLYCGDNLEILREYIPERSVDLVYLDPPFNSKRTYNLVYKDSQALQEAFKDHWSWDEAAPTFSALIGSPTLPAQLRPMLRALHDLLVDSDSDLLAYLTMMTPRLVAMHRALKAAGSLYLHCDPTASHYLKMILDVVFGCGSFQNEIVWQRATAKNDPRRYGRSHDVILFYAKSGAFTWNQQYTSFADYSVTKNYTAIEPETGRRYRLSDLTANKPGGDTDYVWHGQRPYKGRHWAFSKEKMDQMLAEGRIVFRRTGMPVYKRYLDEMPGVPVQDVWTDIRLASASPERIGYPTQKPVALLERIVRSSSEPDDLVLDPFCGCGTTIEACERLGRRWVGIDIARQSVEVIEHRFERAGLAAPSVIWHPAAPEAATVLAERDKLKFEKWVRRKVRAVRSRKKDRGIDGEALFKDAAGEMWHVLVSVKGGRTLQPAFVRDLRGTMEREDASIGVLVSLAEPTKEMKHEAARAGFLHQQDAEGPIPRLQLVTVARLFSDKPAIRAPGVNVTEMPRPSVPPAAVLQASPGRSQERSTRPGPAKAGERATAVRTSKR